MDGKSTRMRDHGLVQILLVEDDDGLELATSGRFDLVVVDVMLPGMDGIAVTSALREAGNHVPVLMLTARDAVSDRVRGLRSGADDYLVKPFAFAELLARIEALTRRLGRDRKLTYGNLVLDPPARRVSVNGNAVELTAKEFDLLECLMRHAGRVLTRSELKEYVWDFSFDARTKVVDLYVHYLRRKLESVAAPDVIETIRGVGYAIG